ncbi:MAG: manganese efflux pump MntP family protein [Rikenellaceae bacterium]|nr:manganese efflux pump MntP family protein [Rikenellaceae bacterium]
MNLITVMILAAGLCFDSFAVSLSCGMTSNGTIERSVYIRFASILAIFQGAMPLVGWMVAHRFKPYIEFCDHWIAFTLLVFLGYKMIKDSLNNDDEIRCNPFVFNRNCILGLATSIDALGTGIAMAVVSVQIIPGQSEILNIMLAVSIIAGVTFLSSISGLFIGRSASQSLGRKAVMTGGITLILIGTKILVEHLFFL